MTKKLTVVDIISEFFATKGHVYTQDEYYREPERPISLQAIKRTCGSWPRMIAMAENAFPERMAIARGVAPKEEVPAISAKEILEKLKSEKV